MAGLDKISVESGIRGPGPLRLPRKAGCQIGAYGRGYDKRPLGRCSMNIAETFKIWEAVMIEEFKSILHIQNERENFLAYGE